MGGWIERQAPPLRRQRTRKRVAQDARFNPDGLGRASTNHD